MAGSDGLPPAWSIVPSSNLGFFFGPGLPRGLGVPLDSAAIWPRLLLLPAEGFFRFFEASALDASPFGAGVEFDSEALSLTSGTFNVGRSSAAGAGEDAEEVVDCSSVLGAGSSKRRSNLGDSLSMTVFPCFLLLSGRAEGDRPGVLDDETAIMKTCGVVRSTW